MRRVLRGSTMFLIYFFPVGVVLSTMTAVQRKDESFYSSIIELENWSSYRIDFLTIEYISSSTDFLNCWLMY